MVVNNKRINSTQLAPSGIFFCIEDPETHTVHKYEPLDLGKRPYALCNCV